MQVAVGQFAAGTDIGANLDACEELIGAAAARGVELVVLPELAMYFDPQHVDPPGTHGQTVDGPFARAIGRMAKDHGVAVIVGMVEAEPGVAEAGDRDFNTVLVFVADGSRRGEYRKIHLYDAFGFRESEVYRPGSMEAPPLFTIAGVRVAVLTCYDLRFPEVFRWVVDAGAEMVVLPAAWIAGPAKEDHWMTLLRARAIENTIYVAGAGQTGPVCCAQSAVIDPMGVVSASAGESPGIAVAEVDAARVAAVRANNPSLANRRFSVVPGLPAGVGAAGRSASGIG